jgi:hypothetical protein
MSLSCAAPISAVRLFSAHGNGSVSLGYNNIGLMIGTRSWLEAAPFDGISCLPVGPPFLRR